MQLRVHKLLLPAVLALTVSLHGAGDSLPRIWTNNLGIKREATFMKVEGNDVTLLLNNGQMVVMSLDKFSPADQDYVHSLQNKAASAPEPAVVPQETPAANNTAPTPAQPAAPAVSQPGVRKKSILLRPKLIHSPDPRVQPGAEIYLPFPELGKSRMPEPMGMRIRVPEHYSPDRPVPLLVWLSGGDGNNRVENALLLVNQKDWLVVGMNYPASLPEPRYATMKEGQIDQIWEMHEKMLAKLQDLVPNIDPRVRVIVGFSNGAHMIGGCLAQGLDGMCNYFNIYVMIEGGDSFSYNYPAMPGKYAYIATGGGQGGRGREFEAMMAGLSRKSGMQVEAHVMEGVGHDFPDDEKAKVKTWLGLTAVPGVAARP